MGISPFFFLNFSSWKPLNNIIFSSTFSGFCDLFRKVQKVHKNQKYLSKKIFWPKLKNWIFHRKCWVKFEFFLLDWIWFCELLKSFWLCTPCFLIGSSDCVVNIYVTFTHKMKSKKTKQSQQYVNNFDGFDNKFRSTYRGKRDWASHLFLGG